ncbi:MAG: OmpA family protein [Bacteroidetes bacterium]|jgi:chemotaxis protein MotB|nr:OmpA family protein [Bacteroidota bacterium]
MKNAILILLVSLAALAQSCVPKKLLKQSQLETSILRKDSADLAQKNSNLQHELSQKTSEANGLNDKINNLNTEMGGLQNDISDLNKKNADLTEKNNLLGEEASSQKNMLSKSQQELLQQRLRLQQLEKLLDQQKQQSKQLKAKMIDALNSFNSNELSVTQKNGKVYVSLSEGLLFPSGSAVVNPRGKEALSKLASVLNQNPDISVNIEGHTDSIPIHGKYLDNWDLSTARANAIVRILTENYKVDPKRVESSGHSKYDPVDSNDTPEGRAKNRRTDIILSPKLDELYKLLEQ